MDGRDDSHPDRLAVWMSDLKTWKDDAVVVATGVWVCGQAGRVHRTLAGCPSSARAERHIHADSRDAVDSRAGEHPLSEQLVDENGAVAIWTRPAWSQGSAKQVAVFTAADANEPVAALAALVDGVIDEGFAALKRLAHSCQIGRGGLMAEPVTALLVSSPTVLRASRRRIFAAHQAAALTITRTLTHGQLG